MKIDTKVIVVFIFVFIFLFIFVLKNCNSKKTIKVTIDTKTEDLVYFDRIPEIEIIDFSKFVVANQAKSLPQNKIEYKGGEIMPLKMKNVLELISRHKFNEAEDMIIQLEKNASDNDMIWLVYFKAQIYYMSGDYHFAQVFFREFLRIYPNHILADNAQKALRYMNVRKFN